METVGRIGGLGVVASLVLLATSGPAAAATRPITGKLSKPGYTVIAVAASGKAKTVRASRGSFKLRPPAARVTLHLRAPNGKYAGPVVIRGESKRAILGVKSGARLGKISVLEGYARLTRRLARRWVARIFTARARNSVPIGARVFGRVRSKPPRAAVPGDRDRDGIPNPLDIDDDGDLILDNLDRSRSARAAQEDEDEFGFELTLSAGLSQALNANAAGITVAQIDALLSSQGQLAFGYPRGDSVELDCGGSPDPANPEGWIGGLRYCTRGGTGRAARRGSRGTFRFPEEFDPDGDGFGDLKTLGILTHGATTAQIGTGDVLIARVTTRKKETLFPATLQYVPATTLALVSYNDGQGNSATVSYPVPAEPPNGVCPMGPPPCSGPGTRGNPFPVKAGPGGVVLTLTFWRPQRARMAGDPEPQAGESDTWTDIGRRFYGAEVGNAGQDCPTSAFSETDPNLEIRPREPEPGIIVDGDPRDQAADAPANPNNTLTYTINVTKCLTVPTDAGPTTTPWNPGETQGFNLRASDGIGAFGQQEVFFRRQE